jgi:hypothetical protein
MIRNEAELQAFEDGLVCRDELSLTEKYRILDAMYEEAVQLGVFPESNPLEGIDDDIRLARLLNHVSSTA